MSRSLNSLYKIMMRPKFVAFLSLDSFSPLQVIFSISESGRPQFSPQVICPLSRFVSAPSSGNHVLPRPLYSWRFQSPSPPQLLDMLFLVFCVNSQKINQGYFNFGSKKTPGVASLLRDSSIIMCVSGDNDCPTKTSSRWRREKILSPQSKPREYGAFIFRISPKRSFLFSHVFSVLHLCEISAWHLSAIFSYGNLGKVPFAGIAQLLCYVIDEWVFQFSVCLLAEAQKGWPG